MTVPLEPFDAARTAVTNPLAQLLAQEVGGAPEMPELSFHQGLITAWDQVAGTNTVIIGSTPIEDVPILAPGAVMLNAGDVVGVLRVRTRYFIVGRISTVGQALNMRGTYVSQMVGTTSTAYTDLAGSPGPTLENVYIGPSRRCLVLVKSSMSVPTTIAPAIATSACTVSVTGASTITADWMNTSAAYISTGGPTNGQSISTSASSHTIITSDDGLNEGLNTFTMKYKSEFGQNVLFLDRELFVLPM